MVYLNIIGSLVSDVVLDGQTKSFEPAFAQGLGNWGNWENWGQTKVERRKLRREHKNKAAYRP